jgi:hypothetical protein
MASSKSLDSRPIRDQREYGQSVSIDAGTIVAVLLTQGFVYCSPLPLAGPLSPLTYRGIFQDAVLAI